jgi:hypothetical protein
LDIATVMKDRQMVRAQMRNSLLEKPMIFISPIWRDKKPIKS